MTPEQIADTLSKSKSAGRGKWVARCPAHDDHTPSLSIREGREGRTLIRCWAGCELNDILAAAGLRVADLFPGFPPSPDKLRELESERRILEATQQMRRAEQRERADKYRRLRDVCDALAARLSRMPDGEDADGMAALFHSVLDKLRLIEATFDAEESQSRRGVKA
jgi:hypothetical protein